MTRSLSEDFALISGEVFKFIENKPVLGFLVITGRTVYSSLGLDKLVSELSVLLPTELWLDDSSTPNSKTLKQICSIVDRFPNRQVIGIGGGRVMDYAKLVSSYQAGDDFGYLDLQYPNGACESVGAPSCALLIPTLFGSGAEATRHAVIYHQGTKRSHSIPDKVTLKSFLHVELAETASTLDRLEAGLDAVCQAVESTLSKLATKKEVENNLESLRSLLANFSSYCRFDSLHSVREFAISARRVGESMNTSKTIGPHAASYYLTHKLGIPHGLAVALTAAEFIDHLSEFSYRNNNVLLGDKLKSIESVFSACGLGSFPAFLHSVLVEHLESVSDYLKEFATQADVDNWIQVIDRARLANHPVALNDTTLKEILTTAIAERANLAHPRLY